MYALDVKWRKYKKCDHDILVALKEPRLVSRVGYEVDYEEACVMVAKEVNFAGAKVENWNRPIRQTGEFDLGVVSHHSLLHKYWSDRANFRKYLDSLLEEAIGNMAVGALMTAIDHAVVKRMVLNHLAEEIHQGQERKIWFEEPPGTMMLPDAKEMWRGPWKVNGWSTVYTGTYYPGGHYGEDDFEPPSLGGAKAHVILNIAYVGKYAGWGEHVALKENTYPWDQEAVAQKMLEGSEKAIPLEF